ncbi:Fosfomycin resistance protein FosA [Labilithrix luteola]|uniref:Fosfomycin resistance protein FosA n=1 Tax=Labilithrix luteola TaxID=1391654 RepID=A0A0K1PWZ7_9BACT|nr:fosfomycin resistance glutathione transferase [Labilithrix luteola]AKU98055.1 Fosfomycin resistance protein FosA [Labilithrix luteola]
MTSLQRPVVRGLNHVTLAVADLERSLAFYRDVLGLRVRAHWPEGAYLDAGGLWLCLSVDDAARTEPHPDYTHVAFDVAAEDFDSLAGTISASSRSWKENRSEGLSLYFLDPDGHKLELHVGSLESRLAHYRANPKADRVLIDDRD